MKLRNKHTGEVTDNIFVYDGFICVDVWKGGQGTYATLAELNADWEDVKPAKPLIKDEKVRKAVRAWWETVPDVITDKRILYKKNQDLAVGIYSIYCGAIYPELEVGKMYTIAELCGEEEE